MKRELNKKEIEALLQQIKTLKFYEDMRDLLEESGIIDVSLYNVLEGSVVKAAKVIVDRIWDLFTDWYGISEYQTLDRDRFDDEYDALDDNRISFLAWGPDNYLGFLNPITVEFLYALANEIGLPENSVDEVRDTFRVF